MTTETVKIWGANQTPSPAMNLIFMSKTGIPYELTHYDQLTTVMDPGSRGNRNDPEYLKMTPMAYIPTVIVGDDEPVRECTSVLRYLSMKFHGLDSDYYPATDIQAVTAINSLLDYHQSSLRPSWFAYFFAFIGGDQAGATAAFWGSNEGFARNRPNGMVAMIELLGKFWMRGGPFLLGRKTPSIADFAILAEVAFMENFKIELGREMADWKGRFTEYLGDDPAWVDYRDNALAALAGNMPPAPAKPEGYPWGFYDHV